MFWNAKLLKIVGFIGNRKTVAYTLFYGYVDIRSFQAVHFYRLWKGEESEAPFLGVGGAIASVA